MRRAVRRLLARFCRWRGNLARFRAYDVRQARVVAMSVDVPDIRRISTLVERSRRDIIASREWYQLAEELEKL